MAATPMGSVTFFIWARWLCTSSQVSWIDSKGAPESSTCPPGSSETLAPSWLSAMTFSPSITASQPKDCRPVSSARIPRSPL